LTVRSSVFMKPNATYSGENKGNGLDVSIGL